MSRSKEQIAVFSIGAICYAVIEILWRQYTHWTMAVTGGICFSILYNAYNHFKSLNLFKKCAIGASVITSVEFMVGVVVNIWQKWSVWDYSELRFNLLGQVCVLYTGLWFLLSVPIIYISQALKKRLRKPT